MTAFRDTAHSILAKLSRAIAPDLARAHIPDTAVWDISAPVGSLKGAAAVQDGLYGTMAAALTGLHRRDEIFIGGDNIRDEGGQWVASITHYVGNFEGNLWGIQGTGHLAFLRAGEFYRIDDGQIIKARIILDLPDLIRQATGRSPFPYPLGTEMLFPGPATHDGVLPDRPQRSADSINLVQRMLSDLHSYDPDTGASKGQIGDGGTWADDMFWYGPGGIGSNYLWDGFVKDHRKSFLNAFPDRKGGNHYCRIGDGDYAAISGWPSITMTHRAEYLGVPPTDKALTLRVMDFYRCDFSKDPGGRIAENWVLLDYIDLFQQLGVDLLAPR
ncbi:ester cyclase [Actibacterium sp. 188UL27-1]|uniref:nuclear transport factor 2 family protein n=1 Tax=Actibacterium sp. 188UL27-1 TaxID=2786961 RepID=UPI00195F1854|nr:ester cyclase [Actibacterium sp. 188UL27-1]MBM7066301.1 ester cyclase [Actibacterium sp. 188UL27-1]